MKGLSRARAQHPPPPFADPVVGTRKTVTATVEFEKPSRQILKGIGHSLPSQSDRPFCKRRIDHPTLLGDHNFSLVDQTPSGTTRSFHFALPCLLSEDLPRSFAGTNRGIFGALLKQSQNARFQISIHGRGCLLSAVGRTITDLCPTIRPLFPPSDHPATGQAHFCLVALPHLRTKEEPTIEKSNPHSLHCSYFTSDDRTNATTAYSHGLGRPHHL